MKLIRRKKDDDHKGVKAVKAVRLAVRGLVAQRVARKAVKHGRRGYKWGRRAPYILGGAAVAAGAAKVLGKTKDSGPAQQPYSPPAPVSNSTTPTTTPAHAPDRPEAPATAEVAAAASDGAPATEPALDVEAPNEATPPPADKDA
jgi:hypothetical protein